MFSNSSMFDVSPRAAEGAPRAAAGRRGPSRGRRAVEGPKSRCELFICVLSQIQNDQEKAKESDSKVERHSI